MKPRALGTLVRTAVLAALAVAFQSLGLHQYVTGPVINAVIYVSSVLISPWSGAAVGLLTPWTAFLTGISRFAPAIPVIMLGNVSLALTSGYLCRRNRWLGLTLAAVVKFTVMTAGVKYLVMTGTRVPAVVYASLTVTQLFTALAGAALALVVLTGLSALGSAKRHGIP